MKRPNGLYEVKVGKHFDALWIIAGNLSEAYEKARVFLDKTEALCDRRISGIECHGTIDVF